METLEEELLKELKNRKQEKNSEVSLIEFCQKLKKKSSGASGGANELFILLSRLKYSREIGITYKNGLFNQVETTFYLKEKR